MAGDTAHTTIKIGGMVCMSCVNSIEGQLGKQLGVVSINVILQQDLAEITYDPLLTSVDKLCKLIEDIGFEASSSPCDNSNNESYDDYNDIMEVVIDVEGMVCMSCVESIESVVGDRQGVVKITVSLIEKTATIKYVVGKETEASLIDAISEMGFDASSKTSNTISDSKNVTIDITGMTCNSCVQSIEEMISGVAGVSHIKVSLENENALVSYNSTVTTAEEIGDKIEDMGFEAKIATPGRIKPFLLIRYCHSFKILSFYQQMQVCAIAASVAVLYIESNAITMY